MISWYYMQGSKKRQLKNVIRSYPNPLDSEKFMIPMKLIMRESLQMNWAGVKLEPDMRIMYKDYIKNNTIIMNPELKNLGQFLKNFMDRDQFFRLLNQEKSRLQSKRKFNKQFVYKHQSLQPLEKFALILNKSRPHLQQRRISQSSSSIKRESPIYVQNMKRVGQSRALFKSKRKFLQIRRKS